MKNPFPNPIKPKKMESESSKPKNPFAGQESHNENQRLFMGGQYYGTGFRAKIGKMRGGSPGQMPVPKKALRVPPESVV